MLHRIVVLVLALVVSAPLVVAGEDAAEWNTVQKAFRTAFKRLALASAAQTEKQIGPHLPAGIVIEAGPFDALVQRLHKPLEDGIALRRKAMEDLGRHASPKAGRLVKGALDTLRKENADLARRVADVEEAYREVYNRGYMESGERQRQTRKLAAVLIPFYRRLLLENNEMVARAVDVLAEMKDGADLDWLAGAATSDAEVSLRAVAVEALSRVGGPRAEAVLRRVLSGDAVSSVRIGALAGLMRWPVGEVEDAVVDALGDAAWEVRSLAVAICARGRLLGAVLPLIRALEKEDGRLEKDIDDALFALVGVRMYADVDLWKQWWKENEEQVAAKARTLAESGAHDEPLGPVEAWDRREEMPEEEAEKRGGTSSFYGITTYSKRILYVVDISRSMDSDAAETPPARGTARHPYAKPRGRTKLAIARWQLHRAIHDLPKDASLGIVVYSESYALWKEEMTPAKRGARTKAHAFVDHLVANGTTNVCDSLDKAFEIAGASPLGLPGKARELVVDTIYLLSDGDPNRGRLSRLSEILEDVTRRNARARIVIHTIGIGEAAGSSFLKTLARRNGGQYVGFP